MGFKIILVSIFTSLIVLPVWAQLRTKAVRVDTIIISKKQENKPTLLASNAPTLVTTLKPESDSGKAYRHVPLAGEISYFGEKTDFVNDFVRKYLELHNRTLSSVQNNSPEPFSLIDNVLGEKQLPKELKYLAVIESALNHNAVSHAGAVGPWQLMAATARMMGLTVNRKHDDRKDWNKSTDAATKYLELLYSQLNDWLLVIAAYNSGPTPVQRAIERTGSHNFWDIKEYLPKETQGHVLAFIATASIFENLAKFINLGSIPLDFQFNKEMEPEEKEVPQKIPLVIDTKKPVITEEEMKNLVIIRINEPLNMDYLSAELEVDKKLLLKWNENYDLFVLKTYSTPYFNLHIPKDKLDIFLQKKSSITKKSKIYFSQNKI